jgi:hypothetical protein
MRSFVPSGLALLLKLTTLLEVSPTPAMLTVKQFDPLDTTKNVFPELLMRLLELPKKSWPAKFKVPSFVTLNLLAVFTCKSISSEAAALFASDVPAALNFSPVNVTAPLFHVWVPSTNGVLAVTVAPLPEIGKLAAPPPLPPPP